VDVKSKPVHFYVQRSESFTLTDIVIPFDIELLNIGDMPWIRQLEVLLPFVHTVDGIYPFEFSALKDTNNESDIIVSLEVNDVEVGSTYATALPNYMGLSGINAYLRLKTGDQVTLYKIFYGHLRDFCFRFTQFSWSLVEEDILLGWNKFIVKILTFIA